MAKFRIAITGVTGLVGRNLLFEIIKQNISNLDKLEIFVLGRHSKSADIRERIFNILKDDGVYYISSDCNVREMVLQTMDSFIKCISIKLEEPSLSLKDDDFRKLSKEPIDIFFHLAALTDLRHGPIVERKVREINVNGTLHILSLISRLNVGQFCYGGTAYCCGNVSGKVSPDFINLGGTFRNPYEKTKLEAEMLVRGYARMTGQRIKIFRISVVCGRLIEQPLGAVSKFDVFYGWAAFFGWMKLREKGVSEENLFREKIDLDMRICFNKDSGLNIVAVDYVAKVICLLVKQNSIIECHITAPKPTPHSLYLLYMIDIFNIRGVRHVAEIPTHQNRLERKYYKSVGKFFTPYINSMPLSFDISNLIPILKQGSLICPPINKKNLAILSEYAKKYNFGIIKRQ